MYCEWCAARQLNSPSAAVRYCRCDDDPFYVFVRISFFFDKLVIYRNNLRAQLVASVKNSDFLQPPEKFGIFCRKS